MNTYDYPEWFHPPEEAPHIIKVWDIRNNVNGVALIDHDYIVIWANPYALKRADATLADVVGLHILDFFDEPWKTMTRDQFIQAEKDEISEAVVTKANRREVGQLRQIIRTTNGYAMIAVDVAQVMEAQKKMEEMDITLAHVADTKERWMRKAKLEVLSTMEVHCKARCERFKNRHPDHCFARMMARQEIESGKPHLDIALTETEYQVTKMYQEGLRRKEIAQELGISDQTVKTHTTSIRRKCGITGTDIHLSEYLRRFII